MPNDRPTAAVAPDSSIIALPPGERPGDSIGPYKLLEIIGEGGFGIVFEAEQARPIRRRVAIKIIKPGMDSGQVIARFEAERQALALMDHPGIARVLDAGTTSAGHPYFVMELVAGEPITRYCDDRSMAIGQRLALFARVCDAVEHAHRRGIVHRDLKPSNILVREIDGEARPTVIDFGVAKALAARLTERTLHTSRGQLIGTPEYVSPEQAEMSGADVDARSDVYSLGVVLYELLTGSLPHGALRDGSFTEMVRVIREVDPVRPSRRVSGSGPDERDAARRRDSDPGTLAGQLRRELDWVPLKAMQKEPARRYQTVAQLRDDVERYVRGERVHAGPDGLATMIRRRAASVARRHRWAALLVVALVAGGLAHVIGPNVVFRWTGLNREFERLVPAAWGAVRGVQQDAPESVRVISLEPGTDFEALAAAEGIAGVRNDDRRSWRLVHARLMEKLARARVSAVGWVLVFRGEEHAEAFAAGVEALRAAGADTWVALPSWSMLDGGAPEMSPTIARVARWGGHSGRLFGDAPWLLQVAAARGSADPVPSIALGMALSMRGAGVQTALSLDTAHSRLRVRRFRPDPSGSGARQWIGQDEWVPLYGLATTGTDAAPGLAPGDVLAWRLVRVPADESLAAVTLSYAEAMGADGAALSRWAGGKAVLLADPSVADAQARTPDGRTVWSVYADAVVIDEMLRARSVRFPRVADELLLTGLGALLGVLISGAVRAPSARWVVLGLLTTGGVLVSFLAFGLLDYMCNPAVPVMAMVVGSEGAALLPRAVSRDMRRP